MVTEPLAGSCDFFNAERLGIGGSSQVPFQFLEALNQEDLAFKFFPLQTAASLMPRVVCSLSLKSSTCSSLNQPTS